MKKIQGRHAKMPDEKMENAKGRIKIKNSNSFQFKY